MTILRFDHYMEQCLYGPDGFYSSGRGVAGGRGGDFITSPEIGALFGGVIARALDTWWHELGCPDPFRIYDVGTGPGTLLRSLHHAAPGCSAVWELVGVDRASDAESSASATALPEDLSGAVVIANELLDNLVFRIVERLLDEGGGADGPGEASWAEVYVDSETQTEVLRPCPDPGLSVRVGQRIPILSTAGAWVGDVLDRGTARLLIFDYGMATTAELAERGGWLRTYRQHERGADALVGPGEWDITTDIAVDQLPAPTAVASQADWLRQWGIEAMVEEGREYWKAHAAAPNVAAMRMRSRINEAEALLDPIGLGSWLALMWHGAVAVRSRSEDATPIEVERYN